MLLLIKKIGQVLMLFKEFKNIVTLLKNCVDTQNKCVNILYPAVFEEHNILISALLKQIYNEYSVEYILSEWLCGNKSPIIFTNNEGVVVEIPINTVRDLWKAMETYGK